MIPLLQKRWPPAAEVVIDGAPVEITVKVSSRAKNYKLSLPNHGRPLLTVQPVDRPAPPQRPSGYRRSAGNAGALGARPGVARSTAAGSRRSH